MWIEHRTLWIEGMVKAVCILSIQYFNKLVDWLIVQCDYESYIRCIIVIVDI